MENESDYEIVLKRVLRVLGILLLVISIYFSYDGFDQSVTGGNSAYTNTGKVIAIILAVTFSAVQFILNSKPDKLNATLVVMGIAAYFYSIYTNYLGSMHILGMNGQMAAAIAFAMDVIPEPLIAWSFGDSLKGDLVGNAGKVLLKVLGVGEKKRPQPQNFPTRPSGQPQFQPKKFNPAQQKGGFRPQDTQPNLSNVRKEFREKIGKR